MDNSATLKKAEEYIQLEENAHFKNEVKQVIDDKNWDDLNDRFFMDLDFGTGGLRGVIGGGFNRMNPYTIRKASQGLANYIQKQDISQPSIAISYDSRNYADLFALEAALVFAANGIKSYLFSSLRPTPELSFAVRYLKTTAGIMVTASHNPAEYNGFKVFWNDGAQVTPPHDKGIISEVNAVSGKSETMSESRAIEEGLLVKIDKEVDEPYLKMVTELAIKPEMIKEYASQMKIVYTPLHGTGTFCVESVLNSLGIEYFTVPEQRDPDGNFPTVDFPNPEIAPAMDLALKYAKEQKADLVMGTDPDADRLGIAVPDGDDYVLISGNQLGALLGDYIFNATKEKGNLPPKPAFINTIVTSEIQTLVAKSYGAATFKVLTGFKFIGAKIAEFENDNSYQYMFGGEESYGYLVGTSVRDKDAVSAASLTAEMALWNKSRGMSILDHLKELWIKHGFFEEILISKYFKGEKGLNIIQDLMKELRNNPPSSWGGINVASVIDYSTGETYTPADGKTEKNIDLPPSNVLQYIMEEGSILTVRPSGTEPKIKFYASCCSAAGVPLEEAMKVVKSKTSAFDKEINTLLDSKE